MILEVLLCQTISMNSYPNSECTHIPKKSPQEPNRKKTEKKVPLPAPWKEQSQDFLSPEL
jgi:hypothetical protein